MSVAWNNSWTYLSKVNTSVITPFVTSAHTFRTQCQCHYVIREASKCFINHSQWQYIHWETKLSNRTFYYLIVKPAWCNYRPFGFISFEGYCLPTNGLFYYHEQVEVMVELYCLLKKMKILKFWEILLKYWRNIQQQLYCSQ